MTGQNLLIEIKDAVPMRPPLRFSVPISWAIARGENWAVVGPNGAGKSTLGGILSRRVALRSGTICGPNDIACMEFRGIYSTADRKNMYYQQRWNATETDNIPYIREVFDGLSLPDDPFGIGQLLDRRIISLSGGELRKLLIARTLSSRPQLLVLDNPFIGLDTSSRDLLNNMLCRLCRHGQMQCVLLVSDPADIPEWIDQVLPVKNMSVYPPLLRADYLQKTTLSGGKIPTRFDFPQKPENTADFSCAIRLKNVRVSYNGHPILDGIDWTVHRGEKWALSGSNGSGKSTLLSLICGDNPQAYANDITLFDRRRGTGESIWDIKRLIGYVSPEMHAFYMEHIPGEEVVASGFFDTAGLFRTCTDQQKESARLWMRIFGAEHLAKRFFTELSYGEQRLLLLIRAFVKNPDLLILDEPFHGLDKKKKQLAEAVIEAYAVRKNKTLIFVSHYRDEIPRCATREMILKKNGI